ncbi:hypothetical protein BaRGS_00037711 [Batillaria attramentaria]|uniref:MAM domain-containing protein n=1 Tax=Batillaria attramentaria TaxID=370345 RepID=A0ABD0J8Y3_9CAEN
MSGQNVGSKARLLSTALCSTGNKSYQLGFDYFIDCDTDDCRMSVMLQENGDSETSLWETTTIRLIWLAIRIENIQPKPGVFRIIFEAERVKSNGYARAIGVDDITLKYVGEVPPAISPTSSPVPTTTQTTLKPSTPTTVSEQTTKQETTTKTELTSTSSTHVSICSGTSQQTSTTGAGNSDSQNGQEKENENTESILGIVVGVAVSVFVLVIVTVIVTIVIRRKNGFGGESLQLQCCLNQERNPSETGVNSEDTAVDVSHGQEQRDAAFAENLPDSATYDQLRPPEERTDNRQYETLQVSGLQTTVASQAESPYQNTAGNREYVNLQANEGTRTQTLSEGRESENQYESLGMSSPPSDYTSLRLH